MLSRRVTSFSSPTGSPLFRSGGVSLAPHRIRSNPGLREEAMAWHWRMQTGTDAAAPEVKNGDSGAHPRWAAIRP